MKRQDGLIICDNHKRGGDPVWHGVVLDDGVTFVPGYVLVTNGNVFVMVSDDPNNTIQQYGVLKNRHKDVNGNPLVTKIRIDMQEFKEDIKEYHFCDIICLTKWINESKTSEVDTQSTQK